MTAQRQRRDPSPLDEADGQQGRSDDAPLRLVSGQDPVGADSRARDEASPLGRHHLELALASRRAAGLPDEIAEFEPWRAFGRAITRRDPPLGTPRTSAVGRRCGFHDAQRLSAAAAGLEAETAALPETGREDRPPM